MPERQPVETTALNQSSAVVQFPVWRTSPWHSLFFETEWTQDYLGSKVFACLGFDLAVLQGWGGGSKQAFRKQVLNDLSYTLNLLLDSDTRMRWLVLIINLIGSGVTKLLKETPGLLCEGVSRLCEWQSEDSPWMYVAVFYGLGTE